jgi:hypothetical protein
MLPGEGRACSREEDPGLPHWLERGVLFPLDQEPEGHDNPDIPGFAGFRIDVDDSTVGDEFDI